MGCASIESGCFMDVEVRSGCVPMKLAVFMDIEVRNGCASIESGFFMDVEVRSGCSADPSARRVGLQVLRRHLGVAKGDFWPVFGTESLPTGT